MLEQMARAQGRRPSPTDSRPCAGGSRLRTATTMPGLTCKQTGRGQRLSGRAPYSAVPHPPPAPRRAIQPGTRNLF
ncbi:hypothetical protein EVAR_67060_1 [Eumeta japonica]|uniref:Uncharacterized protein n=1 Tax=Eumeta variegata TaxID=151549 RepID=A0A4C1ZJX0_EUMVA|nr:hypothetical protein EVAR_67060_1 [Eumeta japonica]